MDKPDLKITRRTVLAGAAQAAAAASVLPHCHAAESRKPPWDPDRFVIWDVHGHLSTRGDTPAQRMENILRLADHMGIERVIVFMGYPWAEDPSPDQFRRQNDQVLEAMEQGGKRVLGFVYLNPKHTKESLAELDRCIRDGPMVGVKLWVAVHCNEQSLDPLVERATELKAPILQHTWNKITGNLPGESTASELAALAARHPKAVFIAAHSGGDWELGFRAIRATTNVTAEICGGDPTAGVVEMAVRELGANRVVYGSDYCGRSFASQLAKVLGANIPEQAKRRILAGNIQEMLKPIFAAKGMTL